MEILEAYDLATTLRGAAALAGCDSKTVAHWVRVRERAGGMPGARGGIGRPSPTSPRRSRSWWSVPALVSERTWRTGSWLRSAYQGWSRTTRRWVTEAPTVIAANQAYEHYRVTDRDTTGRRLGRRPKAWVAPAVPEGVVSVSDPDSQRMKANLGYVQGYNAQAVVDEGRSCSLRRSPTARPISRNWTQ